MVIVGEAVLFVSFLWEDVDGDFATVFPGGPVGIPCAYHVHNTLVHAQLATLFVQCFVDLYSVHTVHPMRTVRHMVYRVHTYISGAEGMDKES